MRVRPNRFGSIGPRTVTACPVRTLSLAREEIGRTPAAPAAANSRNWRRFMLGVIYRNLVQATRRNFRRVRGAEKVLRARGIKIATLPSPLGEGEIQIL